MRERITLPTSDNLSLKEGFEKFLQEKRAMNVSKNSIIFYDTCYRFYVGYVGEGVLCRDINLDTIYGYILHLRETRGNLSDVTINSYLRGLRVILYSLMNKGYVQPFKISLIRAEKKIKETYTDEELERLLKKPDLKKEDFPTFRNWAIICYLLGTGNRLGTLCNVKIGDVDFTSREIRLKKTKNKKQYTIPLSQTLDKVLREYLEYRKGEPGDYLFCNQYGQQFTKREDLTEITGNVSSFGEEINRLKEQRDNLPFYAVQDRRQLDDRIGKLTLSREQAIRSLKKDHEIEDTKRIGDRFDELTRNQAEVKLNCHGVLFDELHALSDRKFFDVMMHGSGYSREQPLNFIRLPRKLIMIFKVDNAANQRHTHAEAFAAITVFG